MADFAEDAYDDAYVPTNEDDDDLTYDTGDDMTLGYSASTPSKKTASTSKANSSNKRITRSASKKKEQELALASSSPALSTKIVKEEMKIEVYIGFRNTTSLNVYYYYLHLHHHEPAAVVAFIQNEL